MTTLRSSQRAFLFFAHVFRPKEPTQRSRRKRRLQRALSLRFFSPQLLVPHSLPTRDVVGLNGAVLFVLQVFRPEGVSTEPPGATPSACASAGAGRWGESGGWNEDAKPLLYYYDTTLLHCTEVL